MVTVFLRKKRITGFLSRLYANNIGLLDHAAVRKQGQQEESAYIDSVHSIYTARTLSNTRVSLMEPCMQINNTHHTLGAGISR